VSIVAPGTAWLGCVMGGVYSGLYLTVAAGIVHGAGSTASQAEGTHSLGSIACISLVYSPNLGGAWGVDTNSIYLPGACSGAVLGDCGAGCGLGSGVKCHVVLCRVYAPCVHTIWVFPSPVHAQIAWHLRQVQGPFLPCAIHSMCISLVCVC
jgi:hypothetical protein